MRYKKPKDGPSPGLQPKERSYLLKSNDPFWNERVKHLLPDHHHSVLTLTISATFGMFTDISTQPTSPVSYPAPTFGALRNIIRHLAPHLKTDIHPIGVEILNPVVFTGVAFNLTGPGRKPKHHKDGSGAMFHHLILQNPRFRVFFVIENEDESLAAATIDRIQTKIHTANHRPLFMGMRDYPAQVEYSNPNEPVREEITFALPSMLRQVIYGSQEIEVYQSVGCHKGCLVYPTRWQTVPKQNV